MAEEMRTPDQDKESQTRTDTVAEYEIALGFRVREVPKGVREALTAEGVDMITNIRLSRVNPFRRSAINEAVQRRFHRDLKNPDILSNAQVMKLVEDRGEWSATLQREMDDLQEIVTRDMGKLWADGLTPDTTSFADEIMRAHGRFHELCREMEETKRVALAERFDRWLSWSPRNKEEPRFPANYDAGLEMAALYDDAPGVTAIDVVSELEELKEKQERLLVLSEQRLRLVQLQEKHASIFLDTAEGRRDQTQQLAQLYWTCERCDAEGKPIGRLAKDFEALSHWPDNVVQWLLYEAFFFHQNIPDVAREYLGAFGFFTAEPVNTGNAKSGESLVPPNSKTDGAPVAEMPVASSESVPATI